MEKGSREVIEAWDLLREAGPQGCATPNDVVSVLSPLRRPLNFRDVAGCLTLFSRTWGENGRFGGPPNPSASLMLGNKRSASAVGGWNLDAFVDAVPKTVNWGMVVRALDDFADLKMKTPDVFANVVVHTYKRATKQAFVPGECFLGLDWRNADIQAALLMHALTNEDVRFEPTVEGGSDSKWSCVLLVETLLRLAERGHQAVAHAALQLGRATDPDSLLLSLLWSKPQKEQLREEAYAALVPALLMRALEEDSEAIRILASVWNLNRELVIRGVLDVLTRDASVLNLIIRLPDGLASLLRLPIRFSLAAACAAANADPGFKLDNWLTERLSTNPEMLPGSIRDIIRFIETRQQGAPSKANPKLSRGCLTALFRVLQACRAPDVLPDIRRALELYRSDLEGAPAPVGGLGGPGYDDIEDQANTTFQLIYSGQLEMEQVIEMLSRFKDSEDAREQSIFQCMIHNLFDEYRFLQKYPDKELRITAVLFGNLMQHQLLSSWTLNMAIKYVLDALRRAPTTPEDTKIFRFGVIALEQFRSRLVDMPHVVADLMAIRHLAEAEPQLYADIERANASTGNASASPASQVSAGLGGLNIGGGALPLSMVEALEMKRATVSTDADMISSPGSSLPLRGTEAPEIYAALCRKLDSMIGGLPNEDPPSSPGVEFEDQVQFLINNLTLQNLEEKIAQARNIIHPESFAWTAYYLVSGRISTQQNFHELYMQFIDGLGKKQLLYELRQRTLEQVRKILKSNKIVTSTAERSVLKNLGSWLGQLTLAKNKPLLHRELDLKELLFDGYERGWLIAILPFVARVIKGAHNSRIFTATNPWMSGLLSAILEIYNLAEVKLGLKFETEELFRFLVIDLQSISPSNILPTRIKPKLASNPDFNSKSTAAPIAASAQTSGASAGSATLSSVFAPQAGMAPSQQPASANQQLHLPQLGFPPQNSGAFQQQQQQQQQQQPFNMYIGEEPRTLASRAPGPQASLPAQQQAQMGLPGMGAGAVQTTGEKMPIPTETQFIPNLASYVFVNNQLALFQKHPELKRVVPIAVDRALHDILQPAVERSVSIATITTRELILKDFAMEPDESKMLKAAHLMATSLAGSMALVTCKEHLRIAMGNNLRQLLTSQGLSAEDMILVDQVVQTSSSENLDLGCLLIEKAAANKALQEIDDALESACTARKEHRETTGQPYYDSAVLNNGMRYPSNLPPGLRPRPTDGGLSLEQLAVYEAFQRPQRPAAAASARESGLPSTEMGMHQLQGGNAPPGAPSVPRMLNSNQALEKYKVVVAALDQAVQKLLQQPGFHEMPASTLPGDHEIIQQLHNVRSIVAATLPEVRFDVAVVLAQSVFKRLYDGPVTDKLRLSVQVGVLEAVSSALDGVQLRTKITEWVVFSIINGKLNVAVTAALVDTHLVGGPELDGLLADLLESQLSSAAVDFASNLVQRCVVQSRRWLVTDASRTLSVLRSIAMGATAIPAPPGLARLLHDVADIAALQQQVSFKPGSGVAPPGQVGLPAELVPPVQPVQPFAFSRNMAIDAQARKDVEGALQRWLAVSRDGDSVTQFLAGLHEKGLFRGDQNMERFFYLCTELCVESFLTIVAQSAAAEANGPAAPEAEVAKSRLAYTGVDSYSLLVTLLVKLADHRVRPTIAAQALEACAKVMAYEVSSRFAQGHEAGFDQRPYFRLILNFQRELLAIPGATLPVAASGASNGTTLNEAELTESADKLLAVFAEAHHHYFSPEHAPGFCFAWLELISHHSFMPKLLKEERGWGVLHRLLVDLFVFMEPYLKTVQLTNAVRMLYRGTLRVLLVLLHDFPEFLCFFHFSLCNVIPPTCVQLRNLILSAFPRTMRLPDPFTPNLKVDLLPEIAVHPRILADYTALLEQTPGGNLRVDIDSYLRTLTQPPNFLATLKDRLRAGGNWHALNALVLHVGVSAITWSKIAETGASQQETAGAQTYMQGSRNIFHTLATELDAEARYHFLNAIANHLRYPNSHTHYFSCVILGLFKEGSEVVQEQVTRVLLERLIVHRPHPWGLLVTFIELMKNPRYAFWDHSFTRCTQEIHKVFESVASSCGASQQAATTMS